MALLPDTRSARVGLLLEGAGVAGYGLFLVALAMRPTIARGGPMLLWGGPVLAILVGSALVLSGMLRHGDRSLLGWLALLPAALFVLLLAAEAIGLME